MYRSLLFLQWKKQDGRCPKCPEATARIPLRDARFENGNRFEEGVENHVVCKKHQRIVDVVADRAEEYGLEDGEVGEELA